MGENEQPARIPLSRRSKPKEQEPEGQELEGQEPGEQELEQEEQGPVGTGMGGQGAAEAEDQVPQCVLCPGDVFRCQEEVTPVATEPGKEEKPLKLGELRGEPTMAELFFPD